MKTRIKKKNKSKVKSKSKIKRPSLKSVHEEILKLCSKANPVSLFHLSVAIFSKHLSYLTSDQHILAKKVILKKRYNMKVSDSLHECTTLLNGGSEDSSEFYI